MTTNPELNDNKILQPDDHGHYVPEDIRQGQTIVFTNGCFDILHPGHHHLLETGKKMGDLLVVGLNSDESVSRLKGPSRPVHKQNTRASNLSTLKSVDYVVIFTEDTPETLIRNIKPDILVKGGDYNLNEIVGYDYVRSYGGKVSTIPLLKGHKQQMLFKQDLSNLIYSSIKLLSQ